MLTVIIEGNSTPLKTLNRKIGFGKVSEDNPLLTDGDVNGCRIKTVVSGFCHLQGHFDDYFKGVKWTRVFFSPADRDDSELEWMNGSLQTTIRSERLMFRFHRSGADTQKAPVLVLVE